MIVSETNKPTIAVILPARNEEDSVGGVVASVLPYATRVIVVDNGSSDHTAACAKAAGAHIVHQPVAGYGRACLAGMAACSEDIVIFMDADAADDPSDLPALIGPICEGSADFVIGSRLSGIVDPGALTVTQQFGNRLACSLMRAIWGAPYTDLGPFRAIRRATLETLMLDAQTYGWTVQMQVRAMKHKLRVLEVPVHYRRRIGTSKISGTVKGVILAGFYILGVIGLEAVRKRPHSAQ